MLLTHRERPEVFLHSMTQGLFKVFKGQNEIEGFFKVFEASKNPDISG